MQASKKRSVSDLQAIGFALAGFTFWVLGDTCIKLVGLSGLPAYEMVAFLGLSMAVFLAAFAVARGRARDLQPHRLGRQLARASLDMANNICVVVALRHLTLTLFYILIFTAPMVIAVLSALFLREGLSWRRSAAVAIGFAGVVIAVNPFGTAREWDWTGVSACLVCVACFSVNMVWSRVLTRTETPESLAFFSGIVTSAIGFALVLARACLGNEPSASHLTGILAASIFGMGLFCALGTLSFYIAVKHTSAANVSQYHYTQLITGTLVSYLIWRTLPGANVLAGAGLIFASGLYIAVTAHGASRELAADVAPLTEGN